MSEPAEVSHCVQELHIRASRQTLAAADPLPDDLREALAEINTDNAD